MNTLLVTVHLCAPSCAALFLLYLPSCTETLLRGWSGWSHYRAWFMYDRLQFKLVLILNTCLSQFEFLWMWCFGDGVGFSFVFSNKKFCFRLRTKVKIKLIWLEENKHCFHKFSQAIFVFLGLTESQYVSWWRCQQLHMQHWLIFDCTTNFSWALFNAVPAVFGITPWTSHQFIIENITESKVLTLSYF